MRKTGQDVLLKEDKPKEPEMEGSTFKKKGMLNLITFTLLLMTKCYESRHLSQSCNILIGSLFYRGRWRGK